MGGNKAGSGGGMQNHAGKFLAAFRKRWNQRARELKFQTHVLWLAYRDPRMPWYAKAWAGLVLAYAFSPIDLIPDFIPIFGYLDDLLLVPLGIALALRMIPPGVMESARENARQETGAGRPVNWVAAGGIILVWVAGLALVVLLIFALLDHLRF